MLFRSLLSMNHPLLGEMTVVGSPVHLSDAPVSIRYNPPRLGEHTEEIIREFVLIAEGGKVAV